MRSSLRAISFGILYFIVAGAARADSGIKITPDVVYGHKDGMALTFDVFRPEQNQNGAVVLFMVSGGWVSQWTAPEKFKGRFEQLVKKGYTVCAIRHGSSPKYKVPEAVDDVRRAVRYVRLHAKDFGIDPNRIGVFGGSAGGHLSLMLGTASDNGQADSDDEVLKTSDRVAAVVAYFPPVDLRGRTGHNDRFPALDFDAEKAPSVSPILFVTPDDPPTLMVHGNADTLVPLNNSERILAEFKKNNVPTDLLVLDGAGHGFKGADSDKAMAALLDWFDKYLKPKDGAIGQ